MLAASAAYWKLGQRAGSSLAGQTLLPTSAAHLGGDVLTHLTFLHGFIPAYDRSIDGAFWSLATEAQFYVLLPLIVLIARRLGLRVAVASMVAISIVYVLAARVLDHGFVSSRLGPDLIGFRLVEFAAGVLVAWLVRTGRGRMWGVAVLVLLGPVVVAQVHGPASAKPFAGALAFGSLVLWAARAPLGARLANLPPLRALGRISYSAYLVHGAAFMLVAIPFSHLQMSEWQRVAVFGLVGLPVAIGAATLLHRTVELRAVAWSHRRPAARSREAVSETSAVGP
jgi:peptidoglycan/LPS O-acetylase OafA/YrhL